MSNTAALLIAALLSAAAAGVLAVVWQRRRCRQQMAQLQRLAMHDPLTGLPGQTALLEILSQQLSLADRLKLPVTVLMLEIDHYARWCAEVDAAALQHGIQELAQRMKHRARTHDVLGRWDDARFLAILPDTDVANALVLVEDLRQLCVNAPPQWQGKALPLTLSTGVYGRRSSPSTPLHDMAVDMVVAAQRALEVTAADGPGRIEIEP